MTRKELNQIRQKAIDKIIKTLLMAGENVVRNTDPKQAKYIPFTWNGRNCSVYSHRTYKTSGSKEVYMPVEYATDTHSDFLLRDGDMIFVDPTNTNSIYKIPFNKMFESINKGVQYDRKHFRQPVYDVLKNTGKCINIEMSTFTNLDGMTVYNLESMREMVPVSYRPLVNKLTKQFFDRGLTQWDQIESMAWEGFAIAMNTYDDTRSKMSFTQFAAFAIRNNILTSLDNELRTVKLSNYAQKKAAEAGETLFNTVSIDKGIRDDDDNRIPREVKMNMVSHAKFADGDIFEYMYSRIESQFAERDCEIFYKVFGLNGFDEMKGKDVAHQMNISEGLVSQKVKRITTWIRKDNELCEMLQNLL